MQADPSPPVPPPAAEVVVSRNNHTTVAASLDLPLSLVKAGRREEMVVRRVLFVNAVVTETRPAGEPANGPTHYRWTLAGFLEREYCVRSLTGLFACTTPEVAALPNKAEGDALAASAGDVSLAVKAEGLLSSTLAARAEEIFAADRSSAVNPFLRAAGVKIGGAHAAKAAPRR